MTDLNISDLRLSSGQLVSKKPGVSIYVMGLPLTVAVLDAHSSVTDTEEHFDLKPLERPKIVFPVWLFPLPALPRVMIWKPSFTGPVKKGEF